MKVFLQNIFLFISPIIFLLVIEALLPPTLFTFRSWEGISFNSRIYTHSPFYPDTKIYTNAVGDLCHHTNKATVKTEYWITDKLGFRNDEFVDEADILFIGDSFIAGSSLSQDETISNRVKSKYKTRQKVYNMAPSSISRFKYYLETGVIKKPKLVIFSIVERDVPPMIVTSKESLLKKYIFKIFKTGNINTYIDKAFKLSSLRWLKSRIQGNKGIGLPAKGNSDMYFFEGTFQKHKKNDLQTTVMIIKSYKKYFDSLGIKFLFVPMPDKETVYYELVPFDKQPNYLFQLDSLLNIANISTINTLKVYNDYRKTNNELLYNLDDSHWNSNATELLSKVIVTFINQNTKFNGGNRVGGPGGIANDRNKSKSCK